MTAMWPAALVGVIGGADGPTVIFVTGSPGGLLIPAIAVLAAVVLIIRKKKK